MCARVTALQLPVSKSLVLPVAQDVVSAAQRIAREDLGLVGRDEMLFLLPRQAEPDDAEELAARP